MAGFAVGDIVVLKSGGPKMTVTGIIGKELLTQWFSGSNFQNGHFPPDSLNPAPPEKEKEG
jgi:uncharacterized protein YodC (DUF2158 family)